MRIVGGKHRGRRIDAPIGLDVRPTADRTREALFNIIASGRLTKGRPLAEMRVLDVFAGSGALGLEALSRGASAVVFIEQGRAALDAIRANLQRLGEKERASVEPGDALRPRSATAPCDIVLMDPPYGSGLALPALKALSEAGWLAAGSLIVIEIDYREKLTPTPAFELLDERRYGRARLIFLRQRQD